MREYPRDEVEANDRDFLGPVEYARLRALDAVTTAPNCDVRQIALHEAGHAVVAAAFGDDVREAMIGERISHAKIDCVATRVLGKTDEIEAASRIAMMLVAGNRAAPGAPDARDAFLFDHAVGLLAAETGADASALAGDLTARVDAILSAHKDVVTAIADVLIDHDIERDELAALLAPVALAEALS